MAPPNFLTLPKEIRLEIYSSIWAGNTVRLVPSYKAAPNRQFAFRGTGSRAAQRRAERRMLWPGEPYPPFGGRALNDEAGDTSQSLLLPQQSSNSTASTEALGTWLQEWIHDKTAKYLPDFALSETSSSQSRFPVQAAAHASVCLLRVHPMIYNEALPVFFSQTNFILEVHPLVAMVFFSRLPKGTCENITQLCLAREVTVHGNQQVTRLAPPMPNECWSPNDSMPEHPDYPLLATPFAAFLATYLPKLQTLSFEQPGADPRYKSVRQDLPLLLYYGHVRRLKFVCSLVPFNYLEGEELTSRGCYEAYMAGGLRHGKEIVERECKARFPEWYEEETGEVKPGEAQRKQQEWCETYGVGFEWDWGQKEGHFLGRHVSIHAVIEVTKKSKLAD